MVYSHSMLQLGLITNKQIIQIPLRKFPTLQKTNFQRVYIQLITLIFFCCYLSQTTAQSSDKPFLTMKTPSRELNQVNSSRQFITGLTCKTCTVSINEIPVKVYNTGAF